MNKHAEIIADTVFHAYPYNAMGFKPDTPHADDCGGCLINSEVEKLITELRLVHVVEMDKALQKVTDERNALQVDRESAFKRANISEAGSVTELVSALVSARDNLRNSLHSSKEENQALLEDRSRLIKILQSIEVDVDSIVKKLKE